MPKFGHFQIAHKIWGRLNAWKGRYVDLAAKTGLFALLDRSRYAKGPDCGCQRKTSKSVKIAVGYTYIIYNTVVLVKSAVIVGIAARIPVLGQD